MTAHTVRALLAAGVLERVPPDAETATVWLDEAGRHLESAAAIIEADPTGAYILLYDAARKALAAHMLVSGLRSQAVPGSHRAIAVYAQEALTRELGPDARRFDIIRRNRNRAEYDVAHFEETEVRKDLAHARGIVTGVTRLLSKR